MDADYTGRFTVPGATVNMHVVAPNMAGEHEVRGTFVATSSTHTIRLGNGYRNGEVWYDAIAVVEAATTVNPYLGEYFDGDTADTTFAVHTWEGATNDSTSVKTVSDSPERVVPPFFGYVHANNSKAEVQIRYRSGWVA